MRKTLVLLVVFFALIDAHAQTNAETWSQKFDAYQAVWMKTRLELVFNQDKYAPGDTAYFKAYFLNENLKGIPGKQLIDLNLVDARGRTKVHFLFNVNDGIGFNQIAIPDTITSGIYFVTTQSNWMRNFKPMPFSKKKITIVQKFSVVHDDKPSINAAPEGGHLVREVTNKVSVVTNRPGKTVQIMDTGGREITNALTDPDGMASLTFKPTRKAGYFVQIAGEMIHFQLPPTEDDGLAMLLTVSESESIKLMTSSPPGSSLREEDITIMVSCRGKVYFTSTFRQGAKDAAMVEIPRQNFPGGIAHLSLLGRSGELIASRDFYNAEKSPVRASVVVSKNYFQTREKVTIDFSLNQDSAVPAGEFAVSVINGNLFTEDIKEPFTDDLSIFSGDQEGFAIDRSNSNWQSSLDNYLICFTEPEPWKEILQKKISKPAFSFNSVIQKSGRVYFEDSDQPVPELTQITLYLQRDRKRYHTFTSAGGRISFAMFDVFGEDEFFYSAAIHGRPITNLKIVWDEEPIRLPFAPRSKEIRNLDLYGAFISKARVIDRSYGFYTSAKDNEISKKGLQSGTFEDEVKGGADVTVNVQDYILFPSMEELIKEVIPSLRTRKEGSATIVRVTLPEPLVPNGDPVYIIDGIATRNSEFFLSMKPADLLTIKIVRERAKTAPFSLMGRNGIVIVETKAGNVREPVNDLAKIVEGVSKPLAFTERIHSGNKNAHRPDFRSTIYWNPSVKTDSTGKARLEFYCSDDIGPLMIRIGGLTTKGEAFSVGKEIEVGITAEKK